MKRNNDIIYESELKDKKDNTKFHLEFAELGVAKAQYNVARCYALGTDDFAILEKKSKSKAISWLIKAVNQNYADAMWLLGVWYRDGYAIPFEFEKTPIEQAVELWTKAAKLGNTDAFAELGMYFYTASRIKNSQKSAFKYFKKGAKVNNLYCQYMLGECYYEGIGTKISAKKALKWWLEAAERGHTLAYNSIKNVINSNFENEKERNMILKNFEGTYMGKMLSNSSEESGTIDDEIPDDDIDDIFSDNDIELLRKDED